MRSPKHSRLDRSALALVLVMATSVTAILLATLRTSTTFDEIVVMAGGARGWATGQWDIAPEHPPLMFYVYGLPVHLSGVNVEPFAAPDIWRREKVVATTEQFFAPRFAYAREFMWGNGNNAIQVAFAARVVAVFLTAILILTTFTCARRQFGPSTAVFATFLVAFLPDTLANGGIAYFDIPVALGILTTLWVADGAIRDPTPLRGAWTGFLLALTLAVKMTAILLGPAIAVLAALEAIRRGIDTVWLRRMGAALLTGIVASYITFVAIYRGDFSLEELRFAVDYTLRLGNAGVGFPIYMLQRVWNEPPWFAYPVLFVFKTPVAFQLLTVIGIVSLAVTAKREPGDWGQSKLRVPIVGVVVFGGILLVSNAAVASRYSIPMQMWLAILVAIGLSRVWEQKRLTLRASVAALMIWFAASSLSFYPFFMSYTSEWGPGRNDPQKIIAGNSVDMGAGLLELKRWMTEKKVPEIWLAYHGSAVPAGYGIRYEPLLSSMSLVDYWPDDTIRAEYTVLSATALSAAIAGDPYGSFRDIDPDTVIAYTLRVYRRQPNGIVGSRLPDD